MEVVVDAVLFDKETKIFSIKVNEIKRQKVVKALKHQRTKIINYLKQLKKDGKIKSIYRPKNKKIKEELNNLIKAKQIIASSIKKLNTILR